MKALLAALLLSAALTPGPAHAVVSRPPTGRAPAGAARLSVRVDPTTMSTSIGQRFGLHSTVRNDSDQPMTGLVAHLNVLGLDPAVYVDPEDWSSQRTVYLDPLAAGGATRLAWTVQAVNSGRLVIYVTVTATRGTDAVTASNALRLDVAPQRTVDAGGVLPLAMAMPAAVLLLTGFAAYRRRRLR
jgi:hypothetical protein